MVQIQIRNKEGEAKVFDLPTSASEMKLRQFIDFIKYYDKWLAIVKANDNIFSKESVIGLSTLMAKFFDTDIKNVLGLEIDYEDMVNGINLLTEKNVDSVNVSSKLMTLVVYIKNIIDNLKPRELTAEDHEFFYKGESYSLPYFRVNEYLKKNIRPVLTAGEVIEIHEIKRKFSDFREQQIKEAEENEIANFVYDPEGNYLLEENLRILSVLAIKDGEERLPAYDTETFIAERMWHFIDIDLQTWVDVSFFLTCIGQALKETRDFITSSIQLTEPDEQKVRSN